MGKRLYRSRKERILGGVCGGIAEYFGIDPAIVRIIAVLLVLVGGGAILAYIVAWIIIPGEPREEESTEDRGQEPRKELNRQVLAWFLIIVGALWLSQFIVPLWTPFAPWVHRAFLPILVLALGILLLVKR